MAFLGLHPGVVSKLAGVVGFTFAFQTAFAAYSVPKQTDKFYDLAGSLGFISTTLLSLYYPAARSLFTSGPRIPFRPFDLSVHHPRQLLVTAMYLLWAGRLGSFLFQRVLKTGKDGRFDDVKGKPAAFSGFWFGQALWVTLISFPAVLINVLPASQAALGVKDLIGLGIWASGFGLEILADSEKSAWRKAKEEKKHEEKFISSGLWSISRHPNYLGEFALQLGPPVLAMSALSQGRARSLVWLSPIFTYVLLRYASGVPPLEKSAEKKWGSDPKWRKYVEETSVLVPLPGGLGKGKAA